MYVWDFFSLLGNHMISLRNQVHPESLLRPRSAGSGDTIRMSFMADCHSTVECT